jgi:hypothetical protein
MGGAGNGGRPHWGKEASFDPAYLRTAVPKLDAFRELMPAYDPDRKFVNDWVAGVFTPARADSLRAGTGP